MIYTLGTSNRKEEEFIGILKEKGIKLVIDIRRFPTSKFEHFKRKNLARILKQNSIDYLWLGDKLGGFRKGGYENYMKQREFKEGIQEVRRYAERYNLVLICCERNPAYCHRRFVAQALREIGEEVEDLI